ncbi:MarR family winged helix-turn-helix transcriptional regulator [Nitrogeniibacter aestuarii]|uniref:MarR family winged helix-turn-helix transcriptional regulator n=1 Tax=Nitrogeniibacter aestuarii TaxID=2815343 RepID=UPI001D12AB34|nr:MarR family transcriptional regulator [Nitrogeniibacter aestuarii]
MSKRAQAATPEPASAMQTPHPGQDHVALRLWLRLLACHNLIESTLRTRLRDEFDTTLARFDLMSQLYRHPEGLRMREVSRLLMVTGGNVTGLADRLVAEGMIERRDDPTDRRAYFLLLTDKGRDLFAQMARSHEDWVVSLLSSLDDDEQHELHDLLGKMKSLLAKHNPAS